MSQVIPVLKGNRLFRFVTESHPAPCATITSVQDDEAVVDDDEEKPTVVANHEFEAWEEKDQRIISWLLSTLSDSILAQVVGDACETSSCLWATLERMFATQSRARLVQLRLQLQTQKKGNKSMNEYLQSIKSIADSLAVIGEGVSELDLFTHTLSGLGPEYEALVVAVTTRFEPVSVEELTGLLLNHE
ncbi:uncharacterized protein LOC124939337 [Impatiens glandulifera]|uniref:uncharacterized protein LOC124939337 n=1 Tax=Impatiens glandulifera TaxID=253017 RepID=UPI001FB076C7|nr:uncharacterized protein LOC124939337 [Impatiens glandulifera]